MKSERVGFRLSMEKTAISARNKLRIEIVIVGLVTEVELLCIQ